MDACLTAVRDRETVVATCTQTHTHVVDADSVIDPRFVDALAPFQCTGLRFVFTSAVILLLSGVVESGCGAPSVFNMNRISCVSVLWAKS